MIRLELSVELAYEVEDEAGADLVLNVQAAQTACQSVGGERLLLSQPTPPAQATDPTTASRFLRVHAEQGRFTLRYEALVDIRHHLADPTVWTRCRSGSCPWRSCLTSTRAASVSRTGC